MKSEIIQKNKLSYFVIIIVLFTAILSGCKTMNPSTMFNTGNSYEFNDFDDEKPEYVIRPYDKLNVRVYTNNGIQLIDVTTQLQVSESANTYMVDKYGEVKLPSVGSVKVQDLTIKKVESLLEKQYSQYYKSPFVIVKVTNRRVVVFTAGSTRGTVLAIENERFTLIEALAKAGGLDDFSKAYRIKLIRGDLKNPKVYLYNIASVEDMQKANMVLQANDIIYVERRGRYTQRFLTEIMPVVTIFNTAVLVWVTVHSLKNNSNGSK